MVVGRSGRAKDSKNPTEIFLGRITIRYAPMFQSAPFTACVTTLAQRAYPLQTFCCHWSVAYPKLQKHEPRRNPSRNRQTRGSLNFHSRVVRWCSLRTPLASLGWSGASISKQSLDQSLGRYRGGGSKNRPRSRGCWAHRIPDTYRVTVGTMCFRLLSAKTNL
jgi:hypothetical protein